MKKNTTEGTTPEKAAGLVSRIIPDGDNDATRALIQLVSALASLPEADARQAGAVAVAERAHTRSNEYGDNLLALMTAAEYGCAPVSA